MNILDKTGLSHLWAKITEKLNLKLNKDSPQSTGTFSHTGNVNIQGNLEAKYIEAKQAILAPELIAQNINVSEGGSITNVPSPTNDTDAANKAYVDNVSSLADDRYFPLTGGTITGETVINGGDFRFVDKAGAYRLNMNYQTGDVFLDGSINMLGNTSFNNFTYFNTLNFISKKTFDGTPLTITGFVFATDPNVDGLEKSIGLGSIENGKLQFATITEDFQPTPIFDIDTESKLTSIHHGLSLENTKITNLIDPVNPTDASNKQYVDNTINTAATGIVGTLNNLQGQINNKQSTINSTGLLKGSGAGTISSAIAGTDYATPNMAFKVLEGAIDFNTIRTAGSYKLNPTSWTNAPNVNWNGIPGMYGNICYLDVIYSNPVVTQILRGGDSTFAIRTTSNGWEGLVNASWQIYKSPLNSDRFIKTISTTDDLNSALDIGLYIVTGAGPNRPSGFNTTSTALMEVTINNTTYTQKIFGGMLFNTFYTRQFNTGTWGAWTKNTIPDGNIYTNNGIVFPGMTIQYNSTEEAIEFLAN